MYQAHTAAGISVKRQFHAAIQRGNLRLPAGGMNINGQTPTMSGSGVTFYNTTGSGGYARLRQRNSQANFRRRRRYRWRNACFFQVALSRRRGPASTINGNRVRPSTAAIYFARTTVTSMETASAKRLQHPGGRQAGAKTATRRSAGRTTPSLTGGSPIKGTILANEFDVHNRLDAKAWRAHAMGAGVGPELALSLRCC